jgi:hypothetical protein
MCFYEGDCDWTASVYSDTTEPATKPTKCDECRRIISIGEPVRHVWMQEHEICRHDPESDDFDGDEDDPVTLCGDECEHDFGETFDYDCCETCTQLIEAIHHHELLIGCREYESRPNLTEGLKYLAKAEQLYPGITARVPQSFIDAANRRHDEE